MKICPKCGAAQNDSRTVCVDCGALLDKPLNKKQSEQIENEISDRVENLTERTDDFRVGALNIILIAVNAAVIVAMVAVMIIKDEELTYMSGFWTAVIAAIGIIQCAFPKLDWELWKLNNRWRYYNADQLAPSQGYCIWMRVGMIIVTVIPLVLAICILCGGYRAVGEFLTAFARRR